MEQVGAKGKGRDAREEYKHRHLLKVLLQGRAKKWGDRGDVGCREKYFFHGRYYNLYLCDWELSSRKVQI